MFEVSVVRGIFKEFGQFHDALARLHDSEMQTYSAYGPTNLRELHPLMPAKRNPVRAIATTGAILGLVTFFLMCIFTSLIYSLIVGGKPPVSNVPYIVPAYEGTILIGSIFGFVAGLFFAALGPHRPPKHYDERFSENRYGIDVHCKPSQKDDVIELFREAGAEEVTDRL